jgi:hypothetical protein
VSVAMGMIVTGWVGGYLLVSAIIMLFVPSRRHLKIKKKLLLTVLGCANRRIHPGRFRRRTGRNQSVQTGHFLRWVTCFCGGSPSSCDTIEG